MKRLALIATLACATPLDAQLTAPVPKSKATGPIFSVFAQTARMQLTSTGFPRIVNRHSGSGIAVTAGYGFNQTIALILTGSSAVMDYEGGGFSTDYIGVGGRFHMANSHRRWVPFLEIALGPRRIRDDDAEVCFASCTRGQLVRSGFVYAQTLGLSFYPTRQFAIVAGGHLNYGDMNKAKLDGRETIGLESEAQDMRLSLGVTWVLSARGR